MAHSTIRKRVESLARVIDWHYRQVTAPAGQMPANPLRWMPRGYSSYSVHDAAVAPAKFDRKPGRRITPDELARVHSALAGIKRDDRERPLTVDPNLTLLFDLIIDTGMRLREAYRLRVDQIDLRKNIIAVEGSKGHRGAIKPRTVPIKPELRKRLADHCSGRVGLIFPWWTGSAADLASVTNRLSQRFRLLFAYAGVDALREHDLRHEACCRWLEMRRPDGAWMFSEVEVCKTMGWSDPKMMLVYASLRGEDLAARMG